MESRNVGYGWESVADDTYDGQGAGRCVMCGTCTFSVFQHGSAQVSVVFFVYLVFLVAKLC